ncbi:MAG: hypothetical protein COA78_18155, partial [Blastopirellula sp.]
MAAMRFLTGMFMYCCVATIIAQGIGVTFLMSSSALSQSKMYSMLAIIYGIDEDMIRESIEDKAPEEIDNEEPNMKAIVDARAERHLSLDFRTRALDGAIENFRAMLNSLAEERRRFDTLKRSLDDSLERQAKGIKEEAILELQRTIEVIDPKMAKEQLLIMIERDEKSMNNVVLILKSMPTDKRKKIIDEFRTEEEKQSLADILEELGSGG